MVRDYGATANNQLTINPKDRENASSRIPEKAFGTDAGQDLREGIFSIFRVDC